MNRALLVGINQYPGQPLNGCVNDVLDMASFLNRKCGFAKKDVRLLTDARATTKGIRDRLGWLLNGIRPGDRILFHYSGHGAQTATRNPQGEVDGLDEVICPVDFDWSDEHMIRDKDFNSVFSAIPAGVEFNWISDSCHSGDLERDLPPPGVHYRTMIPPADIAWRIQVAREQKITSLGMSKSASTLNGALIAGCKSTQTSADAVFNGRFNGALTYVLLQELGKADGLKVSLKSLLKRIRLSLAQSHYSQVPQLDGSKAVQARAFLTP